MKIIMGWFNSEGKCGNNFMANVHQKSLNINFKAVSESQSWSSLNVSEIGLWFPA